MMGGGRGKLAVLKYDILGQDDGVSVFRWERHDLSLFHTLCRLVFIFIGVIVRVFTIQFARVALTFNAVVVWVLRTNEGAAEWWTTSSSYKMFSTRKLTCTDCWTKLDYCQNSCSCAVNRALIVAQHRSILAVNCLENYLERWTSINESELLSTFKCILPMRLGETGADRGIPNGVLNPWLPLCLLLR